MKSPFRITDTPNQRSKSDVYVPRIREVFEALPPHQDLGWKVRKPLSANDIPKMAERPGSMDAYSLPSRGHRC